MGARVREVGTCTRVEHAAAADVLAWQDDVLWKGIKAVDGGINSSNKLNPSTAKKPRDITMLAFSFGHFSLACRLNLIMWVRGGEGEGCGGCPSNSTGRGGLQGGGRAAAAGSDLSHTPTPSP